MSETWHTLFQIEIDFLKPETLAFALNLHTRSRGMVENNERDGNELLDVAARHVVADDTEYLNQVHVEDNILSVHMDMQEMTGSIDQAATFVQELLRFENTRKWVAAEWAAVCEPYRPGGFGGGAVFITKDKIRWLDTRRWLTKAIRDYRDETQPILRPPQSNRFNL